MDYKKLSPTELRKLADELEAKNNLPVKKAFLKEDLYSTNFESYFLVHVNAYVSEKEKNELVKEFESRFTKILPKGAKFVCYKDGKEESWYDCENIGVDMDKHWAKEFLTNFQDIGVK